MAEHEQTADNRQGVVRDGAEKIKGIFSTQTVAKVGTGTTQRKTIQKTYWNVEELDDGEVSVQPLNRNYVPSGPKRNVPRDDFLTKFNPEPEFYISTVYPAIKEMDGAIVRGEKHRERGAAYSAEFEYQQAMAIDEENVRANFGLGLTYLDLFNDFGINMRKNKMYDQALRYYLRAEELVKNDEHLFHNIARCYFEKGNVEECKKYLLKSLEVNPKLDASLKFWAFLKGRGLVAEGEGPNVAPGGKGGKPKGGSAGVNLDAAREDGEPKTGDNGAPKKPASSAPIKLD
jgi:tetratricopeptide (TPR) repeat protein